MKKQTVLAVFCILGLFLVGCKLPPEPVQSVVQPQGPTAEPTRDRHQAEIYEQIKATAMPPATDLTKDGFWYYEDATLPPGRDPLFAICSGKAIRMMQNDDGWDIVPISMEDLGRYKPLNSTAQHSDYMHYIFLPKLAEIHLVDDAGTELKLVTSFHGEYNPEYWIWAWSSLMFIKDCHLRVFYIRPDGSSKFYRFDF